MSMEYYKNYLNNLARNPNQEYRDLQQAIISSQFDNTTLLTTIQEENNFDFNFNPIDVWLDTVTDAITNTEKDVKDYRKLNFEDCEHDAPRGKYYYFEGNYWITYEASTQLESISNCKLRRCNNKLKWIDKDNGKTIIYPCILDYTLSSPNMQVTKKINTGNSHVTVIVQGNKDTIKIKKNQRFIFNGEPYRFVAINNYMQTDYIDENVPLLFLECYLDIKQEDDDTNSNIANTDSYRYKIKILEESFEQVKGFKGKLSATATLDGEEVSKEIIWTSNNPDIVSIDNNGNFELKGNSEEKCSIKATIKNSDIYDEILITIKDNITQKYDIIINPIVEELSLYDTLNFTANLHINGVKQSDKVECIPSGLDESYYTLITKENNNFALTNDRTAKIPLTLTFICKDYSEKINIKLTSLF